MTDRERLIELITDYDRTYDCEFCTKAKKCEHCGNECLADYLLDNGVIVPPCKVSTRVYVITSQTSDNRNLYIFEDTITHYRICDGCTIMCLANHLGVPAFNWDNVFLTREEAEKALAERSVNNVS